MLLAIITLEVLHLLLAGTLIAGAWDRMQKPTPPAEQAAATRSNAAAAHTDALIALVDHISDPRVQAFMAKVNAVDARRERGELPESQYDIERDRLTDEAKKLLEEIRRSNGRP